MRPYMWTPHSLQAWRWIVALGSTTASLCPFASTLSLSRGTTATCEKSDPFGFQHLVQPHTWLCAACAPIVTWTRFCAQLHHSVPPAKFAAAGLRPPSTCGCILTLLIVKSPVCAASDNPRTSCTRGAREGNASIDPPASVGCRG